MVAYKCKWLNGHMMMNRMIKIRCSDKNERRYQKIDRLIKRNSRYWI